VSILRFPDRGPWGDPNYRGNASGHLYRELYQQLRPRDIVEVFADSGTAKQVADELGIPIVALDLRDGFDGTRHSILEKVGHESDLVFGHAPYHTMIRYSGHVWGEKPHPADLSHIEDIDEFIDAMQAVLLNQREATRPGGVYGTLTGDIRKEGRYTSLQAEYIARHPPTRLRLPRARHGQRQDRHGLHVGEAQSEQPRPHLHRRARPRHPPDLDAVPQRQQPPPTRSSATATTR
jgi:hypothetical protein